MGSEKLLLGILAGVAVGATLGILFAPDKGSVTRKKLSGQGDDFAEEIEEKLTAYLEELSGRFELLKKEAVKAAETAKSPDHSALAASESTTN